MAMCMCMCGCVCVAWTAEPEGRASLPRLHAALCTLSLCVHVAASVYSQYLAPHSSRATPPLTDPCVSLATPTFPQDKVRTPVHMALHACVMNLYAACFSAPFARSCVLTSQPAQRGYTLLVAAHACFRYNHMHTQRMGLHV